MLIYSPGSKKFFIPNYLLKEEKYINYTKSNFIKYYRAPLSLIYFKEKNLILRIKDSNNFIEEDIPRKIKEQIIFNINPEILSELEYLKIKKRKEKVIYKNKKYFFKDLFIIPEYFFHEFENINFSFQNKFNILIENKNISYFLNSITNVYPIGKFPEVKTLTLSYFLPEKYKKIFLENLFLRMEHHLKRKYNFYNIDILKVINFENIDFAVKVLTKENYSIIDYLYDCYKVYVNIRNFIDKKLKKIKKRNDYSYIDNSIIKDIGYYQNAYIFQYNYDEE